MQLDLYFAISGPTQEVMKIFISADAAHRFASVQSAGSVFVLHARVGEKEHQPQSSSYADPRLSPSWQDPHEH